MAEEVAEFMHHRGYIHSYNLRCGILFCKWRAIERLLIASFVILVNLSFIIPSIFSIYTIDDKKIDKYLEEKIYCDDMTGYPNYIIIGTDGCNCKCGFDGKFDCFKIKISNGSMILTTLMNQCILAKSYPTDIYYKSIIYITIFILLPFNIICIGWFLYDIWKGGVSIRDIIFTRRQSQTNTDIQMDSARILDEIMIEDNEIPMQSQQLQLQLREHQIKQERESVLENILSRLTLLADKNRQTITMESECSICIHLITEGSKIYDINCHHRFHTQCLQRWLLENNSCPVCRDNIL